MAVGTRQSTVRRERRREIIDATRALLDKQGVQDVPIDQIAKAAGINKAQIYRYFETKDELFLELAGRVSLGRVAAVRDRVAELERAGAFADVPSNALQIVQQVLDMSADDRLGVLLLSEIRIHALRTPALAAAYLAQTDEMLRSVAQIIDDIGRAESFTFRLPPLEAARLLLTVWEGAAVRSVMAGADQAELRRATNEELARVAQLLIAPSES